jgi:hypothetical protein
MMAVPHKLSPLEGTAGQWHTPPHTFRDTNGVHVTDDWLGYDFCCYAFTSYHGGRAERLRGDKRAVCLSAASAQLPGGVM